MTTTLLLILALASLPAAIVLYTVVLGISPMPTMPRVRERMLSCLPEDLRGTVYDLGSGWGALVFALAARLPDCRVVGFEASPLPWLVSRLRGVIQGRRNFELRFRNFFKVPLGDASAVVCYLYPGAMKKLKEKFESELEPGTPVVSNSFAVPSWEPEETHVVRGFFPTKVYVYRVPRR